MLRLVYLFLNCLHQLGELAGSTIACWINDEFQCSVALLSACWPASSFLICSPAFKTVDPKVSEETSRASEAKFCD